MKRFHIKAYEILINEKEAICGLLINKDFYKKVKFLPEEKLYYKVEYNNKKVIVYNSIRTKELVFHSADKELMYYAIKSINLSVMLGTPKFGNKIVEIYEAELE